jgi:hypothetical protein
MRYLKKQDVAPAGQYILITLLSIFFGWLIFQRINEVLYNQHFPIGYDARSYIAGALALRNGYSPYESTTWEKISPGYVTSLYLYPPLLAILLIPISYLPINQSTSICVLLSLLSAIAFFLLLSRSLDWRLSLISVFAFPPTWSTIYFGQINFLVAILLLLSVNAIVEDNQIMLGVYLFTGTLLKITPILSAVLLFLRGYRRSFFYGVAITSVIVYLTLPIANLHTWMESAVFALLQNWQNPDLTSWTGLIVYHLPSAYGRILSLILSVTLIIYTVLRAYKISPILVLSTTILLPLLIAQIIWYHHAVMALIPFLIFWKQSIGYRVVAVTSWLIIASFGAQVMPWVLTFCWAISCWPGIIISMEKRFQPIMFLIFGSK